MYGTLTSPCPRAPLLGALPSPSARAFPRTLAFPARPLPRGLRLTLTPPHAAAEASAAATALGGLLASPLSTLEAALRGLNHPPTPKMPAMLAAKFTVLPLSQSPSPQASFRLGLCPSPAARARSVAPVAAASATAVSAKPAAASSPLVADRKVVRIGLPSKGRMAEQTLSLLKSCQLLVRQLNPRQYTADIPLIPNLEVWFQRPKDIVRKLQSGDL